MVPLLPVTVSSCILEWGEGREEQAEAAQVSFQGHVPDPCAASPILLVSLLWRRPGLEGGKRGSKLQSSFPTGMCEHCRGALCVSLWGSGVWGVEE